MIDRYTRPEMGHVFSLQNKYAVWQKIEVLACEAHAELGEIGIKLSVSTVEIDKYFPEYLNKKNYALTAVSKVAAYGDGLLTLEHSRTEAMASSETVVRYETIDLGTGRELALSDLFKDDGYSKVLSGIVKAQMKEQMKKDESKSYFLDELEKNFEIGKDQPFYIESGKLVLVFNQGTVAPYSMGTCTFEIPTKEIQGSLAQQTYLK